jgi:hypothetical protein
VDKFIDSPIAYPAPLGDFPAERREQNPDRLALSYMRKHYFPMGIVQAKKFVTMLSP